MIILQGRKQIFDLVAQQRADFFLTPTNNNNNIQSTIQQREYPSEEVNPKTKGHLRSPTGHKYSRSFL